MDRHDLGMPVLSLFLNIPLHFSLESRFLGEIASCTGFMFQTEVYYRISKCGVVVECRNVNLRTQIRAQVVLLLWVCLFVFIPKKFDTCKIPSEKFDIDSKIVLRDIFWHQAELVLRHPMQVSNYFVNSFYSVVSNCHAKRFIFFRNSIEIGIL